MANLGWDEVRLRVVTVRTTGFNQDSKVVSARLRLALAYHLRLGLDRIALNVIEFKRIVMVYRRGEAPRIARLAKD
jgi:hypothetical protein